MTVQPSTRSGRASLQSSAEAVVDNVDRVLQGKREVIRMALCCLMAQGHLLVEDVPGVGKTSLAKAMARSLDCRWGRVQFTPDLLPSDVTGVNVFNRSTESFQFRPGAVFTNLLVADEINRAAPRTQSALLEAMEENQVTLDMTTHPLPEPFMVIATQNPLEHLGTYPLPDSQLDRFLMRIGMGYPTRAAELEMLEAHGTVDPMEALEPVVSWEQTQAMIAAAREVFVADSLRCYMVDIAEATRSHPALALGASPRALLALQRSVRAWAAMNGREFALPEDIQSMAEPVLAHRLMTRDGYGSRTSCSDVVADVVGRVPLPLSGHLRP
ncbi:MAG: MoxR family ATPase [Actinomycetota bacterium]|nr:MoxR family ATPase [Actinomycetota bacterium]